MGSSAAGSQTGAVQAKKSSASGSQTVPCQWCGTFKADKDGPVKKKSKVQALTRARCTYCAALSSYNVLHSLLPLQEKSAGDLKIMNSPKDALMKWKTSFQACIQLGDSTAFLAQAALGGPDSSKALRAVHEDRCDGYELLEVKTGCHQAVAQDEILSKVAIDFNWKTSLNELYTDRDLVAASQASLLVGNAQVEAVHKAVGRVKTFLP
eukprot:6492753-Amphidinium_carterae.4